MINSTVKIPPGLNRPRPDDGLYRKNSSKAGEIDSPVFMPGGDAANHEIYESISLGDDMMIRFYFYRAAVFAYPGDRETPRNL